MKKTHKTKLIKVAILVSLLSDELYELKADSQQSKEIMNHFNALEPIFNGLLENYYKDKDVSKSTLIQMISNKLETIIRLNI